MSLINVKDIRKVYRVDEEKLLRLAGLICGLNKEKSAASLELPVRVNLLC